MHWDLLAFSVDNSRVSLRLEARHGTKSFVYRFFDVQQPGQGLFLQLGNLSIHPSQFLKRLLHRGLSLVGCGGNLRGAPSRLGCTLKELPQGLYIHTVGCFLLQGLHLAEEALELSMAALYSLWALRCPQLGTVHGLLFWGAKALLWWGEVIAEDVHLRALSLGGLGWRQAFRACCFGSFG